jgi:hypothetical protein
VAVVGGDEGHIQRPGQLDQPGQRLFFLRQAVVLQLDEEVALAKDGAVFFRHGPGFGLAPLQQQLRDVAGKAGGEGNQPAGILFQQRIVHPGL